MKIGKVLAVGLVLVLFVLFFMTRPVREKACPLTQAAKDNDPELLAKCNELGGVVKNGTCTCPGTDEPM